MISQMIVKSNISEKNLVQETVR